MLFSNIFKMGKSNYPIPTLLILFLNLGTLLLSLACDHPNPPPPAVAKPPPPPSPPVAKPPPPPVAYPPPPNVKPPPPPPVAKPPPPTVKPPPPPPVANPPPPPPPPPPAAYIPPSPPPPPPVANPPPPYPPPPPLVANPPPPPSIVPSPPPPPKHRTCPIDALKLDACVDVLGGLIHIGIGGGAKEKCCRLLEGLVDLDAAICLCTAIKVNLLDIVHLAVPIALNVLVNDCGKHPPPGFQCPP